MLALDRAVRAGLDVRWLLNLYDGESGRVRFHGVRRELIAQQAQRLGIRLVQQPTAESDFEAVFVAGLQALAATGASAILFGNIHLADVRAWYEVRSINAGLHHIEPLWGEAPAAVVAELLHRGYRSVLTGIDLQRAPRSWAGRELEGELASEIAARSGTDPAGEYGEFHTFVFDGPLFSAPIDLVVGESNETANHLQVDLLAT
jgi:uncharacterized protein (TIGR00290 family)